MKTIPLYNENNSLIEEAKFLFLGKPDNISMKEWKILHKELHKKLSPEDSKKFKLLCARRNNKNCKRNMDPEKRKAQERKRRLNNLEKVKERELRYRTKHRKEACLRSSVYRSKYPKKVKESQANWYKKNRDEESIRRKAYREKNKEKIIKQRSESNERNKEKRKLRHAEWLAKNPDYNKKRRMKNPVAFCVRNICWRAVRQLKLGKKPTSTEKWFGCSVEQLKAHIESLWEEGMSWENYGFRGWHVDHIRPVSSFKEDELLMINHYTNLQPLWAKDNLKKSNKIIT